MKTFKTFISEGKYPLWVRVSVGTMVMRMKALQTQISTETDVKKKLNLIGNQNALLSYISGLGVGASTTDKVLLQRMKTIGGTGKK